MQPAAPVDKLLAHHPRRVRARGRGARNEAIDLCRYSGPLDSIPALPLLSPMGIKHEPILIVASIWCGLSLGTCIGTVFLVASEVAPLYLLL